MAELSEEQNQFLEECGREFENRYTDQDKYFTQVKNAALIDPPAIQPWFERNSGYGDRGGQRGGGRGYRDGGRGYRDGGRGDRNHRGNASWSNRDRR